ncbi:alpha/beta hydrolase [Saprospiraceae bacterium]|nr:alpha/beta hydrolase [Saprospiraceae bacterium]
MKYQNIFKIGIFFLPVFCFSQEITLPEQPTFGPGGSEYVHDSIFFQDFAQEADGYWLFEPRSPQPDSARLVVFIHGYGGYNPMMYGKWIKHLVKKGNIVLYPRYQEHLLKPLPNSFALYTAKAIQNGLEELKKEGHVKPIIAPLALIGHSFGGAISADLAINFEKYNIPRPKVLFLCSPGTGFVTMGRLETYKNMPSDIQMLIMVSQDDYVVGDELGVQIFQEATEVEDRNLIRQYRDRRSKPSVNAYHNESYSLDKDFDSGHRNRTVNRALYMSELNPVDYFGYWKFLDALLDCSTNGNNCEFAFGNTQKQRFLGLWSDGTPIKELEIEVPFINDQYSEDIRH